MVDKDSILPTHTPHTQPSSDALATSTFVFNLTVTLKDSKPKIAGAPSKSRKEEQAKALADKAVRRMLLYCLLSFCYLFPFCIFCYLSFHKLSTYLSLPMVRDLCRSFLLVNTHSFFSPHFHFFITSSFFLILSSFFSNLLLLSMKCS